jgi:hypothetical protein
MKTLLNRFGKISKNLKYTFLLPGAAFLLASMNACEEEKKAEPDINNPVTYSLTDLGGTWQRHSIIVTGANYGFGIYGTILNSQGSTTVHLTLPNGTMDSVMTGQDANLSADGVLTLPSDPATHTYLSTDKSLMVGITKRGTAYTLIFDQKVLAGTLYSSADLEGTWYTHGIIAGGDWTGWTHGVSVMDNTGAGISATLVKSDGYSGTVSGGKLNISSDGLLTIDGFASYNGFMSIDKKLTATNMIDGGGGGGLIIAQKAVSGTTYSIADLKGKWQLHDIIVGSENWTEHGTMTIDASGNAVISDMVKDSGGSYNDPGSIALQISAEGIVTFGQDFHGFLSADKKLLIGTKGDDSGNAYSLVALQKMP